MTSVLPHKGMYAEVYVTSEQKKKRGHSLCVTYQLVIITFAH